MSMVFHLLNSYLLERGFETVSSYLSTCSLDPDSWTFLDFWIISIMTKAGKLNKN